MLNRTLYTVETARIVVFGFFLRDLYKHILQVHSEQESENANSFNVYRAHSMLRQQFQKLINHEDGFLTFDNLLF